MINLVTPVVGRVVHYVSYGTPGGEYSQACRAAIITEVPDRIPIGEDQVVTMPNDGPNIQVGLCVLNPTGQFFNRSVPYDAGIVTADNRATGLCDDLAFGGGTWHWPD